MSGTPMYKVAFAITRPTHNPGQIQDVEAYFFDDVDEADACLSSLASTRLADTRTYEEHRLNWELLKRRHKPSAEREAYKHAHLLEINRAYCHMHMVLSEVETRPTRQNPVQKVCTWGSAESVTGNLYSVTLCKHQFYLENDPTVVQKKSIVKMREILRRSYV